MMEVNRMAALGMFLIHESILDSLRLNESDDKLLPRLTASDICRRTALDVDVVARGLLELERAGRVIRFFVAGAPGYHKYILASCESSVVNSDIEYARIRALTGAAREVAG